MGKHSIRLIISDIDGTILNDQHQVDQELQAQIPHLHEKGIPLVLASARSPLGMEPIMQEFGLLNTPLACYNGALVIKGSSPNYDILIEHSLDKKEIQQLLELVSQHFPTISINLYSGKDWFTEHFDKWVQKEAAITGEIPTIQDLAFVLQKQVSVHKLLLIGEPADIQKLQDYLQNIAFPQTAFYLSKENYLEVTAKNVSKENALLEIAHFYHVPLQQIMAIGDNFNDLPMLKLAGLGVAMGNAPKAVKEQAAVVTQTNNEGGVAQAIRQYILD
ncbi:Putative phosphatase [Streptococcus constellatus]|uniref:Phosphatase n=1 Tax=Streptococcus constellatus TaxID=76860 RepID=A0A564T390_STRCV|nr:Cof-type HAD-IIB family hydrolase [Streptococcus constellatus]VUX01908.1 Putative phosphatase [Streptococcus constellatus]VUX04014.1 Putative phosphatase [Streptococcus gordonii]